MDIAKKCAFCGGIHRMKTDPEKYHAYAAGEPVQNVFPEMDLIEREFLKIGTCPACQKEIFGNNYEGVLIR